MLAINKVVSTDAPDRWCLTGANYGPASFHHSQAEAKAAAQHWDETGERSDQTTSMH